jgi:polyhydroxyalkanoate synthesis regulator phasin
MTDDVTALRKEVADLRDDVERIRVVLKTLSVQSAHNIGELRHEFEKLDRRLRALEAK